LLLKVTHSFIDSQGLFAGFVMTVSRLFLYLFDVSVHLWDIVF